ncbi:MAG: family 2 glycosyl transferase [Clostridiaceae bacterium]
MKKILFSSFAVILMIVTVGGYLYKTNESRNTMVYEEEGIQYVSKVEGKDFLVYQDGEWVKKFLKGVNVGAAKPGTFPGELAITKDEYLRWFKSIKEMNADVIRVYTTMKPEFYEALYEFNKNLKDLLYLMQGVWINEEEISLLKDAYAEKETIKNNFIKDSKDLVDIIHGKANLPQKSGFASGKYTKDVSPYVIGWILGIEWDPYFVQETNENNKERNFHDGNFLYTDGASPFETFLCEVGDEVLTYEAETYKMYRTLSFTNWLTTDPIDHSNEPDSHEDMSVVDMEHIKVKDNFSAGLFASYHIYPYYPDFLSYQKSYVEDKDEEGKINTYKAYLKDLIEKHTMPVLVAEFGVPASRGKAHDSLYSGYNQGNLDEKAQGEIIKDLLGDIQGENYCGALVFTWQDEWFKRTWNTADFDLPESRPLWSNPQTNEQEFGLMAFDPGEKKSIVYVDGDIDEWTGIKPTVVNGETSLFLHSDEKYLYLLVKTKGFELEKDTLLIPIDSIDNQGNATDLDSGLRFEKPADFIIRINGKDNTKILVDSYYDSFYFLYGEKLKMIENHPEYKLKNSGLFNPMLLCLSKEIYLDEDEKTIPFSSYETGKLVLGDGNPRHETYNSLTDFAVKDGHVEIRIPWQLLNVMDPSTKSIMQDLYQNNSIEADTLSSMNFGVVEFKSDQSIVEPLKMNPYTWDNWTVPTYHERLKPSYYILQEAFKNIR